MFGELNETVTVRHELQEQIDKNFHYFLNQSLNEEKRKIDSHYAYSWVGDKGNLTINYELEPKDVDIEREGITFTFLAKIKDYTNWTCEFEIHWITLNPKIYGGIQEFVSFDVFKNSLKYAIDNGYLDIDLTRKNWESRFFQFYAGDLYEVIPKIGETYKANEVVAGLCTTSSRDMTLQKMQQKHHSLNVTMDYDCELSVAKQKVTSFKLQLALEVEG